MVHKSRDWKKAYIDLFHAIGVHQWSIAIAAVLSIVGSILNLIGPNKLSDITNLIIVGLKGSINLNEITEIVALLCILYMTSLLFNYMQGYIMATVAQRITQNMRQNISRKIDRLPLSYFDRHTIGDTLSRVTNDVDTVGQTMNQSFATMISSLAMLVGSVIMMFVTNWVMALAGILASLIGFVLMMLVMVKSQQYFDQQQQVLGRVNGHVEETISGHTVLKAYNGEKLQEMLSVK